MLRAGYCRCRQFAVEIRLSRPMRSAREMLITISKSMVYTYHSAGLRVATTNGLTGGGLRKAFASIEPQLLHISQDVIRSTWKTLPNSTEQKVQELLRSVERPVIARHVGQRAQIEAQVAIRSTIGMRVVTTSPAFMHCHANDQEVWRNVYHACLSHPKQRRYISTTKRSSKIT